MNKGLIATLVGVVAIAAIVAGCGGSDDDTASLTKAQFMSKADAICNKGNAEIESEFEAFADEHNISEKKEPTKAQQVELAETVLVPNVANQAEELRTLDAPSGDEGQISAMLDSLEQGVEESEDDPEALFKAKSDPFGPANKMAKAYGLKVCGRG